MRPTSTASASARRRGQPLGVGWAQVLRIVDPVHGALETAHGIFVVSQPMVGRGKEKQIGCNGLAEVGDQAFTEGRGGLGVPARPVLDDPQRGEGSSLSCSHIECAFAGRIAARKSRFGAGATAISQTR